MNRRGQKLGLIQMNLRLYLSTLSFCVLYYHVVVSVHQQLLPLPLLLLLPQYHCLLLVPKPCYHWLFCSCVYCDLLVYTMNLNTSSFSDASCLRIRVVFGRPLFFEIRGGRQPGPGSRSRTITGCIEA